VQAKIYVFVYLNAVVVFAR